MSACTGVVDYCFISGCPFLDAFLSSPKRETHLLYHIEKKYLKMSYKKKSEQRKEFKEYLSIADIRVLDIKKSGIELIANR